MPILESLKASHKNFSTGANDLASPCVYLSSRPPSGVTSHDRPNRFLSLLAPVDKLLQSDMLARHDPYLASGFDDFHELAFSP